MQLDELTRDERLALGGLIRMMVRSDGEFSAAEEATINGLGQRLGGDSGVMWRVISQSAQDCPGDDAVLEVARRVERPEAQQMIRALLEEVAAGDLIAESEHELLAWVDETWG